MHQGSDHRQSLRAFCYGSRHRGHQRGFGGSQHREEPGSPAPARGLFTGMERCLCTLQTVSPPGFLALCLVSVKDFCFCILCGLDVGFGQVKGRRRFALFKRLPI